jgi:hypothetical protein
VQLYQIFSEESQENADLENLHLMGVLFKMENYGKNETMINYQNQYGQEHVGPDR